MRPHPSPGQLAAAGTDYPPVDRAARTCRSPFPIAPSSGAGAPAVVWPDAFGSPPPVLYQSDLGEAQGAALLNGSPYARAFALARRLRAAAADALPVRAERDAAALPTATPTTSIRRSRAYPLESFLFTDKRGYCQQFAGAMALLLRLGGVPARVAAGFTSGQYDTNLHRYVVTDYDAHAWVEAFFPGYGWVRFDPTPASADPAQQHSSLGAIAPGGQSTEPRRRQGPAAPRAERPGRHASRARRRAHHGGVPTVLVILAVLAGARAGAAPFDHPPDAPPDAGADAGRARARVSPHRARAAPAAHPDRARAPHGRRSRARWATCRRSRGRASAPARRERPAPAQRRALRGALALRPRADRAAAGAVGPAAPLVAAAADPGSGRSRLPRLDDDGRRVRALHARDRIARGRAQPPGHDPALPRARPRPGQDVDPRGARAGPVPLRSATSRRRASSRP